MKNPIKLSAHFDYKTIFRFTLPTIITMVVLSVYSIVDGFFVSNFVGKNPFAAINLVWPVLNLLGVVGFMFGTGGSALVGRKLGQGYEEDARKIFTQIVIVMVGFGIIGTIIGLIFMPQIATALGATKTMLTDSILYGRIVVAANVFFVLQFAFQSLFITAERPITGLVVSIAAGITNILLDFFLVYVFPLGTAGAALATALSELVGGMIPLIYFAKKRGDCKLYFVTTNINYRDLAKAASNGASEMLSNISSSLVSMVYNIQLLKFASENGVAAYGVIMYVIFIFLSVFIGYSQGMAPVISYHYGANNRDELKSIYKKSMLIIGVSGVAMLLLSKLLAHPLALIYVSYDTELMAITENGLFLYATSFLIAGFNIFGSAFFTALNNGLVSGLISFMRTFIFQLAAVLTLPMILGLNGIWLAITFAEGLAVIITGLFLLANRKKYGY